MGIVGFLLLLGNDLCFLLLFCHRSDDLKIQSTWLCSADYVDAFMNTSPGRTYRVLPRKPLIDREFDFRQELHHK